MNHLCVKHLDGNLRAIAAFATDERVWIVLIGEHDEESVENIYDELYQLLEIEPPETARTKPPCCDEDDESPSVLDELLDDIIGRAKRLRHNRRADDRPQRRRDPAAREVG